MTETATTKTQTGIELDINENRAALVIGGIEVDIFSNGNVVAYANDGVETRPVAAPAAIAAVTAVAEAEVAETEPTGTEKNDLSISKDFNAVSLFGATVELDANGTLVITSPGKVQLKPGVEVPTKELVLGQKMKDGTIFAGLSPDTGRPMYVTSADEKLKYSFNGAVQRAEQKSAETDNDYRVPTAAELNVLYENRNIIGGFNLEGNCPDGMYWSSSPGTKHPLKSGVWQRFSNGQQSGDDGKIGLRVRLVRN